MKKRDFLTVSDLDAGELRTLLDRAAQLKRDTAGHASPMRGRSAGMLFDKSSTRTRVSFEVGIHQLGGHAIFLTSSDLQLGRGETIADTARVLSRYLSLMVIRTFEHRTVEEFARHADMPVINALTDAHHPCQALADLLTVREYKGGYGIRMAYIGDGNNVTHSLIQIAARLGMELVVACPEGHEPDADLLDTARREASAPIEVHHAPRDAAAGADVLYTDTWVSMGQEDEAEDRIETFAAFQVNREIMARANPDALFMHCLPAHRGEEVTADVIDGAQSVVWQQAENRLHAQKALLEFLLAPGT